MVDHKVFNKIILPDRFTKCSNKFEKKIRSSNLKTKQIFTLSFAPVHNIIPFALVGVFILAKWTTYNF